MCSCNEDVPWQTASKSLSVTSHKLPTTAGAPACTYDITMPTGGKHAPGATGRSAPEEQPISHTTARARAAATEADVMYCSPPLWPQ